MPCADLFVPIGCRFEPLWLPMCTLPRLLKSLNAKFIRSLRHTFKSTASSSTCATQLCRLQV